MSEQKSTVRLLRLTGSSQQMTRSQKFTAIFVLNFYIFLVLNIPRKWSNIKKYSNFRFHIANSMRSTEVDETEIEHSYGRSTNKLIFGWLVDFINHFGRLNGFKILLERFKNGPKLTIQVIAALLK
jgi:hypothetical protein